MHAFSIIVVALGAAGLVGASNDDVLPKGAKGCYADDPHDRVLKDKWTSNKMTPSACANYCYRKSPNYTYYATQYGKECWCQDSSLDLRHGKGHCNYRCSGNSSVKCGGFDAFTLYDLSETEVAQPPKGADYVGCYGDSKTDRVLGAKKKFQSATSETCKAYCVRESSDNMYYATQYGNECWCAADVSLRHPDKPCDMPCAGDSGTTCGGDDAFDLFKLDDEDGPNPPTEDYYVGCFADDTQDRVLGNKKSSGHMTLKACERQCKAQDQPFFALQFGSECWCGGCELQEKGQPSYDRHGEGSCATLPCSGDSTRQCGGYDEFSLYYRGDCDYPTPAPLWTPAPVEMPTPISLAPLTVAPVTPAPVDDYKNGGKGKTNKKY